MQLFNKIKNLRLWKANATAKRPPSKVENSCQTDPLISCFEQSDSPLANISIPSSTWTELCRRSNQWPNDLPSNPPSQGISSTTRIMHSDNLLYHTAKLHLHHWTLLSQQDRYKTCKCLGGSPLRLGRKTNMTSIHHCGVGRHAASLSTLQ
jgi:hypothetical protein